MSGRQVPYQSASEPFHTGRASASSSSFFTGRASMANPSGDRNRGRKVVPLVSCLIGIGVGMMIGLLLPRQLAHDASLSRLRKKQGLSFGGNSGVESAVNQVLSRIHNQYDKLSNESSTLPCRQVESRIPRGAESLPPGIIAQSSDLYQRRLWGKPEEDLPEKPRNLLAMAVGVSQIENVNKMVAKFMHNFTIILFHYDGNVNDWDALGWPKEVIRISAKKQTKWWFAKRFLHPDVVDAYDYIFIWDEDIGVESFDAAEYINLVRKHNFEISQPGLYPDRGAVWQMTKRQVGREAHSMVIEQPGYCRSPHLPPCGGFVEIMVPVFSKAAWRCIWYLIQNDLVHGWGLDMEMGKCAPGLAYRSVGVVDAQWVEHLGVPSLGGQGEPQEAGKAGWEGVRERCHYEWTVFSSRLENAVKQQAMMENANAENGRA